MSKTKRRARAAQKLHRPHGGWPHQPEEEVRYLVVMLHGQRRTPEWISESLRVPVKEIEAIIGV